MKIDFNNLERCYTIAEIGVNHNGCVDTALKMVKAASESGADAVKFQTFTADALVTHGTPKVKYQENTTPIDQSHYEMIKSLEFSREDHIPVTKYCDDIGIDFISTPYDVDSAKFLNKIGVDIFKVASADIVDYPLNKYLADTGKTVIVSTGMASLGEVEDVVEVYLDADNSNICLLHCVSNYPCSIESLNLNAIKTLSGAFNLPVGFSDHSVGSMAAMLSVALGVNVIEKHFTLDKNMTGPDHQASSTPEEFKKLVRDIRNAEKALGSPVKKCQEEERQMSFVSRKSIVAAHDLPAGKKIEESDLLAKRPGTGISPFEIKKIVGRSLIKDVKKNTTLDWHDLSIG